MVNLRNFGGGIVIFGGKIIFRFGIKFGGKNIVWNLQIALCLCFQFALIVTTSEFHSCDSINLPSSEKLCASSGRNIMFYTFGDWFVSHEFELIVIFIKKDHFCVKICMNAYIWNLIYWIWISFLEVFRFLNRGETRSFPTSCDCGSHNTSGSLRDDAKRRNPY